MPLTWNVEKIKDHKTVTTLLDSEGKPVLNEEGSTRWNPITLALASITQIVGIPKITQKNYLEFYRRMFLVEAIYGASLSKKEDEGIIHFSPSLNDIKQHIGLYTNAPTRTKNEFRKFVDSKIIKMAEASPDKRWVWRTTPKSVKQEESEYSSSFYQILLQDLMKHGYDGLTGQQKEAITGLILKASQ